MSAQRALTTRINFAVMAEILYLCNISVLPIVAFVVTLIFYFRLRNRLNEFERAHFRQAIVANITAGLLLLLVGVLILVLGGFSSPYTWMVLIVYFMCCHSVLILLGVFALTRALNQKVYIYPVVGRFWR